jgi:hypothetical protein
LDSFGEVLDGSVMSDVFNVAVADLIPPFQLILADCYSDGTVWFRVEDGGGRTTCVCIDGREGSRTRYRLFDGSRHPGHPGVRLLELGGVEEGVLVPLISEWVSSPEFAILPAVGRELFLATFNRYGEPPP